MVFFCTGITNLFKVVQSISDPEGGGKGRGLTEGQNNRFSHLKYGKSVKTFCFKHFVLFKMLIIFVKKIMNPFIIREYKGRQFFCDRKTENKRQSSMQYKTDVISHLFLSGKWERRG